jgi:hypothetical protein
MALTLTYNHPFFPAGQNFDVRGIGLIPNKQAKVLTAAEEASFLKVHGRKVEVASAADSQFQTTGTPLT